MKKIFMVIFFLIPSQGAYATVYGAGATSCGKYLSNSQNYESSTAYLSWAMGYLSVLDTLNEAAGSSLKRIDHEAMKFWLDKYCREHPTESFFEASAALVNELK